jgi:hypothetical protein
MVRSIAPYLAAFSHLLYPNIQQSTRNIQLPREEEEGKRQEEEEYPISNKEFPISKLRGRANVQSAPAGKSIVVE